MIDKYEIMTELFLSNPKLRAWHPRTVYETLKEMDERGQLFQMKKNIKGQSFISRILEKLRGIHG